jgi:hypothetical protein
MLYASGRQLGASARITLALTLSANARNVNLRALANAAGYQGTAPVDLKVTIAAGVVIGSTSTSTYSLDTGTWPNGTRLTMTIASGATIAGCGGDGGNNGGGLNAGGSPGTAGGPALRVQVPITITNSGTIGGGGGGGSGANDSIGGTDSPFGGGGAGDMPGGSNTFNRATLTTGGPVHRDSAGGDGVPGKGGDLGMPGESGSRAGGAAGIAVTGNAQIQWAAQGSVLGPIQN